MPEYWCRLSCHADSDKYLIFNPDERLNMFGLCKVTTGAGFQNENIRNCNLFIKNIAELMAKITK